jgi:hypothetical protein
VCFAAPPLQPSHAKPDPVLAPKDAPAVQECMQHSSTHRCSLGLFHPKVGMSGASNQTSVSDGLSIWRSVVPLVMITVGIPRRQVSRP